jgi:rhodanese-related sulfurtransferase
MIEKTEMAAILANSALFGKIGAEALEAIGSIARERIVPPGTVIGRRGEPGNDCFLIASGRVALFREDNSGVEAEWVQLGPGESFGEVALLSDDPIPASVKSVEEARLILFSRERFDPLMREYPELKTAVGKGISLWLHRAGSPAEHPAGPPSEAFRMRGIDLFLIIGLSLLCALTFNRSNPKRLPLIPKSYSLEDVSFITAAAVFEKNKNKKILIVDAMPSYFYDQEHIPGAVNLPLAIFDFIYDMKLGKIDKSQEIVVCGRSISKHYDEEVAEKLVARGFKQVKILNGGLSAWKHYNYPVAP